MSHRYPLDALAEAMRLSVNQACKALGVSGSTMQDYRQRGLTEKVADRLAVKAGLVAYEVWPEMVDHHIEACSVECADEKCGERFVPEKRSQRYCSPRCRERRKAREKARRRYRDDAAFREAQKARVASYRDEVGDGLRRQRRAEYQRNAEEFRRRRRERYAANPEPERAYQREYRRREVA